MSLYIGLHISGLTSSAAIFENGNLLFAAPEERISRVKYTKHFPLSAINAGLKYLRRSIQEVTDVAISWNPAINIGSRYRAGFSEWPSNSGARFYSIPNHLLPRFNIERVAFTSSVLEVNTNLDKNIKFHYFNHHDCHAEFGLIFSDSSNHTHFVFDGYGESATASRYMNHGGRNSSTVLSEFPHSLGMFYATMTSFLGLRPFCDEWKLMGAAAYGDNSLVTHLSNNLIKLKDGEFELCLEYFDFYNFESRHLFSKKMTQLLGDPFDPNARFSPCDRFFNIAFATQRITENIVLEIINHNISKTKTDTISLSGGLAMNCHLNGVIARRFNKMDFNVGYSPDDTGNAIGAGIILSKKLGYDVNRKSLRSPFHGPAYSESEVQATLEKFKCRYSKVADVEKVIAAEIVAGKVVGCLQGRMEFGQRALGNRSIFADPRSSTMREKLNQAVKFRENYRPFAPIILAECADEWLEEFDGNCRFMEKTFYVKSDKQKVIPAVVHVDGSARVQVISIGDNPFLYGVLEEFYGITGVPVLLNTSFNVDGEPIVCSPEDAIRSFYGSGLDCLFLETFRLAK